MPTTVRHAGPHGARIDLVDDHDDPRHRIYAIVDADGQQAHLTGLELNALAKAWIDEALDGGEA